MPRLIIADESTLESFLDDLHGRWENLRDDNASDTPSAWDIAAAIEFLEAAPVAFPMALEMDDSNIALQLSETLLNLQDYAAVLSEAIDAHWEGLDEPTRLCGTVSLSIDAASFRKQKALLVRLANEAMKAGSSDAELLDGILNMLDTIHDEIDPPRAS